MLIELAGLLYTAAKDLKDYLAFKEEKKQVDREWLEKSGFVEKAKAEGIDLGWVQPHRIASLELDGWEVCYEIDKINRIRCKLVQYDGTVLMKKQKK